MVGMKTEKFISRFIPKTQMNPFYQIDISGKIFTQYSCKSHLYIILLYAVLRKFRKTYDKSRKIVEGWFYYE